MKTRTYLTVTEPESPQVFFVFLSLCFIFSVFVSHAGKNHGAAVFVSGAMLCIDVLQQQQAAQVSHSARLLPLTAWHTSLSTPWLVCYT